MARKMFGEDKPVQRNVESPGFKNRSPGQSNAAKAFPSVFEDAGPSTKRDIERVGRGLNPTAKTQMGLQSQQQAAGRAVTRLTTRAGLLGASLGAGLAIGDYIEEKTGLGKKFVDAVAGDVIDKIALAGHEPAKLSEYSESKLKSLVDSAITRQKKEQEAPDKGRASKDERVNKEDYPTYRKDTKSAESFREEFKKAKEEGKESFSFEGRKYSTEEKTEMAKGGMVKAKKKKAVSKPKAFSVGGYAKLYGKK
jgi:hypothetical protein